MKRILLLIFVCIELLCFWGCSHSDDDVQKHVSNVINVYYNEIVLDWDNGTFSHGEYTITIPDRWGYGIEGRKEKFKEYDPHDIIFSYMLVTYTTYGGDSYSTASFKELVYKKPEKLSKIFEISTVGIDIDSKLFVKDELVDDCYFKYDTNNDYYNFCYFKIAKNDINQLKEGYFNQINVELQYYKHIDSSYSFMIDQGKDGLNNIGFFDKVSISYNPDLIE